MYRSFIFYLFAAKYVNMRKLLYIFLILVMIGCTTTKYIPVETVRTEYKTDTKIDSIHTSDSVYIYINGDTVIKYKERLIYRNKIQKDTIIQRDTIPVIKTEEKEVNKLKWYQELLMLIGTFSIGYIFYRIQKYVRNKIFKIK